jgi:glycine/serine hydroxymethyltransferase
MTIPPRGLREPEMVQVATLLDRVLSSLGLASVEAKVRDEVQELTNRFPLYPERRA